jgi:hypothetical protein
MGGGLFYSLICEAYFIHRQAYFISASLFHSFRRDEF